MQGMNESEWCQRLVATSGGVSVGDPPHNLHCSSHIHVAVAQRARMPRCHHIKMLSGTMHALCPQARLWWAPARRC